MNNYSTNNRSDLFFTFLNAKWHMKILALYVLVSTQCLALQVVNIHDRAAVKLLYNSVYLASNGIQSEWSGNVADCDAGDTSDLYKNAVLQRINYFRSMSGVGADIRFDAELNRKASLAALMMSANNALSANPPESWICYNADGGEAAGLSNLGLGIDGYDAITFLMEDSGANNTSVGHRRWIYYPQTQLMGTGDIVSSNSDSASAHASIVQDQKIFSPRPVTRDGFVSWPPPGFVPYQLLFPRWSFSYANADFSNATVAMTTLQGESVDLAVVYRSDPPSPGSLTAPENTITWIPTVIPDRAIDNDIVYNVSVENIVIDAESRNFQYTVTAIDPSTSIVQPPGEPEPILESGVITLDHQWQVIEKPQNLKNPVLIVGTPTYHGVQPGVIQVRNEQNQSETTVRFREWNYLDKIHAPESVAFLFVEEGVHNLLDGTMIQVGRFKIDGTSNWKMVQFLNDFAGIPHVFVSLQTVKGFDTAALRVRNVAQNSFDVSLIEQENLNASGHVQEDAAYVAIYNSADTGIVRLSSSLNAVQFSLATTQVGNMWTDILSHRIKLEEEQSMDSEVFHLLEKVDLLVLDNSMLFSQIVSQIGADPVVIRQQ